MNTRTKPRQPTTLIFIVIAGTIVLSAIGFLIAYAINKMKDVTPSTIQATTCCSCHWSISLDDGTSLDLGTIDGKVTNSRCTFSQPYPNIGEYTPVYCEDIDAEEIFDVLPPDISEGSNALAEEHRDTCQGGCIAHSSNPLIPPADASNSDTVTLSSLFELRYAQPPNDGIKAAEMIIEYPEGMESPEPFSTDDVEEIFSTEENGNRELPIKVYEAVFETTWGDILDLDTPGVYTVKFRAQNNGDVWTETSDCTRTFEITEAMGRGEYCYDLDIAPLSGTGPLNVTLTADAGIPEGVSPTYEWRVDLNCNGTIDSGTGSDAEEFTTTGEANSVTKTFTIPEDETELVTCPAEVTVLLGGGRQLQDISSGSCSGSVALSQASADCGNGTCEANETCDTDGNLKCPAETPLPAGTTCRENCTYCGDGVRNGEEDCDTGITQGEIGYEAECQSDCTLPEDGTGGDDDGDDTGAGVITISQQVPACLERVSPRNAGSITITVANSSSAPVQVRAVSDALPLGISFTPGSSVINGTANTNDTGLTVETTGNSQMVTWNNGGNGWTIPQGGSLSIAFQSVAGQAALTGTQMNRVTVTHADENPIPSESQLTVAQICTQPDTGVFDNNIRLMLIGLFLLIVAAAAYYTGFGTREIERALSSASSGAQTLLLRLAQPQKYMEKQIVTSALKKIQQHANDKKGKRKGQS